MPLEASAQLKKLDNLRCFDRPYIAYWILLEAEKALKLRCSGLASPVKNTQIQLLVRVPPKEDIVNVEIAVTPCDVVLAFVDGVTLQHSSSHELRQFPVYYSKVIDTYRDYRDGRDDPHFYK